MVLEVYNTLSRGKEEFKPLSGKKVGMYVCGITPYDYCHMGHARAQVVFDMVTRYLRFSGYDVKYVQNFTDVDDKIIAKARKEGDPLKATAIAARFIEEFFSDMGALGVQRADVYPKVSEHIPDIISLVEKLVKKGVAYELDGDVYYDISKFPPYGKLSRLDREQIKAGARVEVDTRKHNPEDFALWKAAKPDEPYWESPWGRGRPGWHIECSAMSMKYLGEQLDVHGGGQDLIFPHHENEIAQSEGAMGKTFAKYWLHNGFITVNTEKMSKSLGNFFTIKDVLKQYVPEAVRFFLLSTHYRAPIDFSNTMLDNAENNIKKLRNSLENLDAALKLPDNSGDTDTERSALAGIKEAREKFIAAMDDDFNTPLAIAAIFEVSRSANTYLLEHRDEPSISHATVNAFLGALKELGGVLNIFPSGTAQAKADPSLEGVMQLVIELRKAAREKKDYAASDLIRSRLEAAGIALEDHKDGSVKWKKK